jgi:hypothetical protein
MKKLILIDACRQPKVAIKSVNILKNGGLTTNIIVAGVMPRIRWWREGLSGKGSVAFIEPNELAQGATRITMTMIALEVLDDYREGWHWILIGADRAYVELASRLQGMGVDIDYLPAMTPEQAFAMSSRSPSIAQRMRELADQMLKEETSLSIPIGKFADLAIRAIPEIRDPGKRSDLFGATRFARVLSNIGVRTSGGRIVGVD